MDIVIGFCVQSVEHYVDRVQPLKARLRCWWIIHILIFLSTDMAFPLPVPFVLLTLFVFIVYWYASARRPRRPDGPAPAWFIGNVLQVPVKNPEHKFTEWAYTYGKNHFLRVLRTGC